MAGHFGSRHFGTTLYLREAIELTAKPRPVALYIGAASRDDRRFGTALAELMKAHGAGKVVWPTSKETWVTAVMVFIMTALLALFFFGIDSFFSAIVQFLLSLIG